MKAGRTKQKAPLLQRVVNGIQARGWTPLNIVQSMRHRRLFSRQESMAGSYKRVYHYHVRKTGGTSLNHSFLALADAAPTDLYKAIATSFDHSVTSKGRVYVGWNKRLIERGHYFYAYSHIPAHQLRLPSDTFTVTVLRHPIDRILSHYAMLLDGIDTKGKRPWDWEYQTATPKWFREESQWLGSNLRDFLAAVPREHLLRQLYMFSAEFDVDEAFRRIIGCSHCAFLDDLSADLNHLSKRLGLELPLRHDRRSRSRSMITPSDLALLEAEMEPELRLYVKLREHYGRDR